MFGDDESAVEADVDNRAEILDRHVGDQADIAEPGAVDARYRLVRPLVEQLLYRVLVGDVGIGAGVRRTEFGSPGGCAVGVTVGHERFGSRRRQAPARWPSRFPTLRR